MANIKDLKKSNQDPIVVDMTGNSSEKEEPKKKEVVNLNDTIDQGKRNHQHEKKNNKELVIDMTTNNDDTSNRTIADLSEVPDMTPEEAAYAKEHFVENPMDKMLEGEDSLLGKYLVNKEAELKVAYDTVEYNRKVKELETEAEITGDDSELIDFLNKNPGIPGALNQENEEELDNVVIADDDDILSSLDNNVKEETEDMSIEDKDIEENGPVGLDDELYDNTELTGVTTVDDDDFELDDSELDDEELYPEDQSIEEEEEEKIDIEPEVEEIDNDDSIEEEEEESSEEEVVYDETQDATNNDEDLLAKLKSLATERLKPVSKRMDISSFTVVKKPISNVKQFKVNPVKSAKWVLMYQQATVFMKEFTGAELEKLREFTQDASNPRMPNTSALMRRYRMIYDHITSPKPATFEQWLKTTPVYDEDSYFFAIYIASFKGANYIPRDCVDTDKCKETWLTDDIPIMDMVKFGSDEAKAKFTKIYHEEDSSTTKAGLYVSEVVPISANVAIAFKEPSLYNRVEFLSLDNDFRNKYSSIIDYIPYIDSMYFINEEDQTLIPVGYKSFSDNTIKTTKSKVQQFAKVLDTLSIDEFGIIRPYVRAIEERSSGVSFILPESTCPKCQKVVPEVETSAEELLFTRYQLGALVNTSLN